jgi:hypothetical protein
MLDPISAIAGAIIAGAIAAVQDTAQQAIKDAYNGLKALLIERYKLSSLALIETNPSNSVFQKAVEEEIRSQPTIADNQQILAKAKLVHELLQSLPPPSLAAWGLDAGAIKAQAGIILERISGTAGGIKADAIEAGRNVHISDVHGGTNPGKC